MFDKRLPLVALTVVAAAAGAALHSSLSSSLHSDLASSPAPAPAPEATSQAPSSPKVSTPEVVLHTQIDKGTLAALNDQLPDIRALPHRDASGQTDGLRLSSIRRGSPLDELGIHNGDIIHSINGVPVVAGMNLPDTDHLVVDLTRREVRTVFGIDVGPPRADRW